ncbi:bifunctional alpha/beta hydrolase/OsmC family protein [Erythrobacter sp.]|uniref:bifunctional alpha/beta hydrolase/OsmC family protein n=1 Tax=Erythrobacter sp. TaxID=1042 RepID=UPI001B2A7625|nr:bifunctional alpha/beta hydrolase/OsmC family protein [Erythrobacter sp.]MBO6526699.1 bifunctional alpha/beta hydrolase/OsmC family protein [Erythrobacter sp.]MBO6531078.1 bifunctional alpha/beta hydrolase/OsmC family protein [Erythrobacter sp.]
MPTKKITIATDAGHTLEGSLELPTGLVRGAALFAHCFTCTKQSRAAVSVSRALAKEGIACLRFDFTGLGGSEGEFGRAGFATDVADLVAAAEELLDRFAQPILLVGHSLGGAAVLAAADDLGFDKVAAIATIGAPSDVPHVLQRIDGDLEAIRKEGEGEVTIGGRDFALSRDFLEKVENTDLLEEVARLKRPLLFLHSPTDDVVGIENASALFRAAKHPKSFVSLEGADHLLLNDADAHFAASVIASWAGRYIPMSEDWPMPEDGVVVKTGHGKFGTEVHTRTHRFVADEPTSYGGDDTGPTPYDLLNAALGTCTAMTMKMYADKKGWPLEGVTVEVIHERNHKDECDHVEAMEEGRQMQALNRKIELHGDDLDEDQRRRIIEIADKCPVHRTLEGELHVHTVVQADRD